MDLEVHTDTAPDSGGGVSAFETMVTEYHEGQEKTGANNRSAPRVGNDKNMHHAYNCSVATFNPKWSGNQNRTGRVRNRKARQNFQVPK